MISCSVKTGKVPVQWKRAHVVPFYKSRNQRKEAQNYRLVSLTSIISKMCGKIIKTRCRPSRKKINESQERIEAGWKAKYSRLHCLLIMILVLKIIFVYWCAFFFICKS